MITTPRTEEKILTTDNVDKCINMYLAKPLLRTWKEDFTDEDTGEVVTIERNEMIAQQGDKVDNDIIPIIRFHMSSFDITEITVSNQKRKGMHVNTFMVPWLVSANIDNKTRKLLVHAISADMAIEIATDYIELNFDKSFYISQVKHNAGCHIIERDIREKRGDDEEALEHKFYKIEMKTTYEDEYHEENTYIILSSCVDTATVVINHWIGESLVELKDGRDFTTSLVSAVVFPCNYIVPLAFSKAYADTKPTL